MTLASARPARAMARWSAPNAGGPHRRLGTTDDLTAANGIGRVRVCFAVLLRPDESSVGRATIFSDSEPPRASGLKSLRQPAGQWQTIECAAEHERARIAACTRPII
jgi:hypothetical protein